ncbi:hypothetical protein RJ639_018582 [Escallonia herrerae]|uniref:Retrotransposon Copia-like N-terminal domain-containing protein n=1 Tax=Escallonia herrerae TaxID=1293975 RepID=A0AA88V990_9ASTE|nr:hypothetical protein RJ639_018582 [Escallonia herrerae]
MAMDKNWGNIPAKTARSKNQSSTVQTKFQEVRCTGGVESVVLSDGNSTSIELNFYNSITSSSDGQPSVYNCQEIKSSAILADHDLHHIFLLPLLINRVDHPGHLLVPIKLNRTNYPSWSKSMIHALTAKNKIGFINGSIEQP